MRQKSPFFGGGEIYVNPGDIEVSSKIWLTLYNYIGFSAHFVAAISPL